jgi:DNA-binding MarR family transcriptional regulator
LAAKKRMIPGGGPARAALESRALLAARALVDRMRTMYRELEQMTGAPITLHRALVCIGNEPGLPASRLAARLGMKRPAVSQLLKNLATRGWIERRRSEADQRTVHVHCTAAGRQVLQATAGRAVFTLQSAVCHLPDEQLANLASGIEKLLEELPQAAEPARATRSSVARSRGRLPG